MKQPPAFVITLKNHRLSESLTQECLYSAKKHNWDVQVFNAINGNNVTDTTWINIGVIPLINKYGMSRPGTQGCFLSHFTLWKKCLELNREIVIVEHDAIFEAPWDEQLTSKDQLVKLTKFRPNKGYRQDEYAGTWSPGAIAYLINPKQAKQLITFAKTVGALPTDVAIGSNVVDFINLDYLYVSMNKRMENIKYSTTAYL
jgi:GR25 family glycosyltransferase involved in LPS biosynthesis